jgi:hypothetical protein
MAQFARTSPQYKFHKSAQNRIDAKCCEFFIQANFPNLALLNLGTNDVSKVITALEIKDVNISVNPHGPS